MFFSLTLQPNSAAWPGRGHSSGSLIARCDGSPRRPPAPAWLCIKRGGMFTRPQRSEPRCCASSITFLSGADSSAIVSHSSCRLTRCLTTVATRLLPPFSRSPPECIDPRAVQKMYIGYIDSGGSVVFFWLNDKYRKILRIHVKLRALFCLAVLQMYKILL